MKHNNMIIIGVIILILLVSLSQVKKTAGENVKFRVSDLAYDEGSTIALNINCDGLDLSQFDYMIKSHITTSDYCSALLLDNLPGDLSNSTSSEPVRMYGTVEHYVVCQKDGTGGRWETKYSKVMSGTQSPVSIDASREIPCPAVNSYSIFIGDKGEYISGVDNFNSFIIKANGWIGGN